MKKDNILHLDLTEQDNQTLAWSLNYVMNINGYYASKFLPIYALTQWVFAKPSRYIEMSSSNFLKLCDVLLTVESKLGCCGRQQDAEHVRRKIHELLWLNENQQTSNETN